MTARIGIVADDLTGAADALAPFRARGYDCDLVLDPGYESAAHVVATVTYSRALNDADARARTRDAVRDVIADGRRPYLKIDSTMRGPIAAQLEGALDAGAAAFVTAHAIVCPAYPEMGRVVSGGVVFVDGIPLADSVFTADPRNPVTHSAMVDLIPGAVPFAPSRGSVPDVRIAAPDALDAADLDAVVAAALADPSALLAGSAGMSAAWARALPDVDGPEHDHRRPDRVLLVASSRHPVTLTQIEHLPADLFSVLEDSPDSESVGPVTVLTAPSRFSRYDASRVLESLARQAISFIDTEDVQQLVLLGGDGAAAVLNSLGVRAISLLQARLPGHAEGVIRGGPADGMAVITRAGGFGTATTLADLLRLTLAS